ncbi:MAG: glycine cleavage system aminomethyltransferase GcvT [Halobacteriales archaeon]
MSLRRSPLRDHHEERGARFTDFGGWEMPVSFDSIREEHAAVRERAGKFDISHMGEIEVEGPDAAELMGRLTTNDPAALDPGEGQYAAITNEEGIILDDTVLYRRGEDRFLFVPNAGHDEAMADRWATHRETWGLDAAVENVTGERAMIAVQGPDAVGMVADASTGDVSGLGRFETAETAIAGVDAFVARTGYTGEDGVEVILPWEAAEAVWSALECQPCGLGARDTLRLEAGLLLSGQDFDPEDDPRNPYEAGIGFVVDLDTEFVGREAIANVAKAGVKERIVGIELTERGVPRHGYAIETPDGEPIGTVTSGTMSPTLETPIGLGYVPVEHAEPGTDLRVVVRDEPKSARVRETPFLQR